MFVAMQAESCRVRYFHPSIFCIWHCFVLLSYMRLLCQYLWFSLSLWSFTIQHQHQHDHTQSSCPPLVEIQLLVVVLFVVDVRKPSWNFLLTFLWCQRAICITWHHMIPSNNNNRLMSGSKKSTLLSHSSCCHYQATSGKPWQLSVNQCSNQLKQHQSQGQHRESP